MLLRQILVASFALASAGAVAQTKKDPEPAKQAPAAPLPNAFQLGIYRLVPAGTSDDPGLQSIEDTFLDVAQASRRYRSVVKLNKPPKLCELEDDNCFALLGGFQQLDQVLVGEILRLQNGAAVKVRLIDVQKGKAIGQKALTVQTEDKNEIKSWAEALACDLLNNTTCKGQAIIDVDLPDMRVIVDNLQYPRTGRNPETFTMPLGVHSVRVMIDQRTSLERKLLVSRDAPTRPALFARQLEGGGISLQRAVDLQLGASGKQDLAVSVATTQLKQTRWTRPVGLTVAGVGVLAAAIGGVQGLHSKSLINDVNKKYDSQHAYLQSDLASIDSAKSAASTANVLFIVGGVLLAAGLTMSFAF